MYNDFAACYDELMDDVDYSARTEYLCLKSLTVCRRFYLICVVARAGFPIVSPKNACR
ncbi:MAG: hypothetical protein MJ132_02960 [Clostridia bacterium]|nr:hypothetical protein [Clostridia bacterium]